MGLESQISDLQETLESLFNHGVPSSLLDKLRRVTTPREEELAATIVQSANQSLKQINNSLQQLSKVAGEARGAAG